MRHSPKSFIHASLVILCLSSAALAYSGGTGEPGDPYQIADANDWQELMETSTHWSKSFVLVADVNLAGTALTPVGTSGTNFSGTLNGLGHVIHNATIIAPYSSSRYTGLFGYTSSGSSISELTLASVSVTGYDRIGSLVGYNTGTVSDCRASGVVIGAYIDPWNDPYSIGGLIGYNTGNITNCHADVTVTSDAAVYKAGGLVAQTYDGTISNCSASGSLILPSGYHGIGGLIGAIGSGSVTGCFATGDVEGVFSVGGLIGEIRGNTTVSVSKCYATGSATASSSAGGLIGYSEGGVISNCYASGAATGLSSTGGIGGLIGRSFGGSVNYCYSTGNVSGDSDVGGLIGYSVISPNVTRSYWDMETSGQTTSAGGTGKKTVAMRLQSTYVEWDFTNTWRICGEDVNYPRLRWQLPVGDWTCPEGVSIEDMAYFAQRWLLNNCALSNTWCVGTDINHSGEVDFIDFALFADNWVPSTLTPGPYSGGTGESNDPYRIATRDDWRELMYKPADWGKSFVLTGDLNLFNIAVVPVGNINIKFTGSFDGDGHVIRDATIDPLTGYAGLFGYLGSGGRIRDLGMESANVTGGQYTGGLVGYCNYGHVDNCYFSGLVHGSECVGGLVGYNYHGDVNDCHAAGAVTSHGQRIGGLVGFNEYGSIAGSYATCSVTTDYLTLSYIGGLTSRNYGGTITNCYASGAVTAPTGGQYVGGLAGSNSGTGTITNCYSTGSVSGTPDSLYVGGLAGFNSGTITASFWDTEVSGWSTSAGGTGKTTLEMKTRATFTAAGWDFTNETDNGTDDFWRMDVDGVDYPRLSWQP